MRFPQPNPPFLYVGTFPLPVTHYTQVSVIYIYTVTKLPMHLIKPDFLSIPKQSARIYIETGRHIQLVPVMEERRFKGEKAFQYVGYMS